MKVRHYKARLNGACGPHPWAKDKHPAPYAVWAYRKVKPNPNK